MVKRVYQPMIQHFQDNRSIYFFMIGLFGMGLLFGAIVVNALPMDIKHDLQTYLNRFFKDMASGKDLDARLMFTERASYYIKYVLFIWILGFTIIGLPIIFILMFLKGFVMGFTIGFLVSEIHLKGFGLALAALFPSNLFIVPLYIVLATFSSAFSLRLFKQLNTAQKTKLFPYVKKYFLLLIGAMAVCFLIALFEAHVTPVFIHAFSK